MKKKLSLAGLLDHKRFLQVFALVVAVLLYIAVSITQRDTIERTIHNVPVSLNQTDANLANLRLYIVEGTEYYTDITVVGPRTVVPKLGPDSPELATTVRLTGVTEPGNRDLQLVSAYSGELPFTIDRYSPRTAKVRFDRYKTSSFDIKPVVNGLLTPPGYITDNIYTTPGKVMVTGPEADVAKIVRAEVVLELTEPLESNHAPTLSIALKDAQGEEIDPQASHLTMDITETQLVIPVLKQTTLPLEVEFTTPPRGFPVEELRDVLRMSVDSVDVAGPPDVIERLTEIRLGYIDIKNLRPNGNSFPFQVNLKEISDQLRSLDNITTVNVYFEDADWETARFNIREIRPVNLPLDYTVEVLYPQLEGIEFVGKAKDLETLTADDIVAEIDLSERELLPGQYTYPVKISAPGRGIVWAVGDHTTIIRVEERE